MFMPEEDLPRPPEATELRRSRKQQGEHLIRESVDLLRGRPMVDRVVNLSGR